MPDRNEPQQQRYSRLAPFYEGLLQRASFGRMADLHRATANALGDLPGGVLVELGCGPGNVSSFLLEKVGDTGTLIGVDLSEPMIARARDRAQRSGFRNARYVCADMLTFRPDTPVDAVVFALSLTLVSDCAACLEHARSLLRPGGKLVVLDSIPDPSRRLANLAIRVKAPLVGANPSAVPLVWARSQLEDLRVEHHMGGIYTVISGRRPGGEA